MQSIEMAATDLYVNFRRYEVDADAAIGGCNNEENCGEFGLSAGANTTVVMGGARIKF